jgi:serpin B
MSSPPPGHIDDVIHEGYISVDERGTEASAATAIVFVDAGAPSVTPPILRLDHPFLLFIRHVESGAVLFMGRVANPAAVPAGTSAM